MQEEERRIIRVSEIYIVEDMLADGDEAPVGMPSRAMWFIGMSQQTRYMGRRCIH